MTVGAMKVEDLPGMSEACSSGLIAREQQIVAIVKVLNEEEGAFSAQVFDLTRSLIEDVCQSILEKRVGSRNTGLNMKPLVRMTLEQLNMTSRDHDDDGLADSLLKRVVEGLLEVADGVSALRNTQGFSAHASKSWQTHETAQAMLVARASDTLIGFLVDVHFRYDKLRAYHRPTYLDSTQANDLFDNDLGPIEVLDLVFSPSRILFDYDRDAYIAYVLADHDSLENSGLSRTVLGSADSS